MEGHGWAPQHLLAKRRHNIRPFSYTYHKMDLFLGLLTCTPQCDRAAQDVLTSVRNWERQVCMQTHGRKNMPIMSSRSGIGRTLCLPLFRILWNKRPIPLSLPKWFRPTTQDNGIQRPTLLGIILIRTQEIQGEVVKGKQYNHNNSPTKNNHEFL